MNKKSQGLSINVIIVVAIALIVLVVLIAVFTGRVGNFVFGVDKTVSCETNCKTLGMDMEPAPSELDCIGGEHTRYVPGDFADVSENAVCCCKSRITPTTTPTPTPPTLHTCADGTLVGDPADCIPPE